MYALVKLLPNLLLVVLWPYALRIDAEACSIREELDKLMALQQPLSESCNNSSEKEKDATVEVCLIFLHRQMHIHIQINRFCTVQYFHLRKAPPFRVRILVLICLSIFLCQCNNHLMFGPFGAPIYHIKRHSIHIRLLYFIVLFMNKAFLLLLLFALWTMLQSFFSSIVSVKFSRLEKKWMESLG